jgi:hypothetical protein
MKRIGRLALLISSVAAGAACTTDVSSVSSLGTQGRVLGGVPFLSDSLDLPHAIAAGANGVYYATSQYIGYCPLSGCPDQPVEYYDAVTQGQVALAVTDAQNIYWTEFTTVPPQMWLKSAPQGVAFASNPTTVYENFGETVESRVDNLLSLGFLAVDGGILYWTTNPGPDKPTPTPTLSWCSPTSCTNPSSVPLPDYSTVLAVKDAVIYLAKPEDSGGALTACHTSPSGSCTDIVDPTYDVSAVTRASIDGGTLYFVAYEGQPTGGLYACALPTCDGGPKLVSPSGYDPVVSAGVVYAGIFAGTPGFGTCRVDSCSAGPQRIDLPFEPPTSFGELGSPSAIVAAPTGGAYAYTALVPPLGSRGLSTANDPVALVYLPPPSP